MGASFITLLPTLICGLWAVVLALDIMENGDRGAHRKLLLWAVTATTLYLCHTFYFAGDRLLTPIFDSVYVGCNLAVFPLYLRYIIYLTEGRMSKLHNVLVLVPPPFFTCLIGMLYAVMSADERVMFTETYLYDNSYTGLSGLMLIQAYLHTLCKILFAIGVVVTLVVGMRKVKRYNSLIDSIFSDVEDKSMRNVTPILIFMACTCVISFIANTIGRHVFVDSLWLLSIPFVLFSVMLFAIGYTGYRQTFSYSNIKMLEKDFCADTVGMRDMDEREAESMSQMIMLMMSTDRLFLIPNLKVSDLANRLGTNCRYVQQSLNEEMGMSFAEYINRQRVMYAKKLMEEKPGLTMSQVGLKSGFASVSAFYRNMKMYG